MLDLVRLADFGARRPDRISGGCLRRAALAPARAADASPRHDLRNEPSQVFVAVGSTAIVVTHDQEEAMSLGGRVFGTSRGGRRRSARSTSVAIAASAAARTLFPASA